MNSVMEAHLVMHAVLLFTNNLVLVLASLALLNSEPATTSVSTLNTIWMGHQTDLLQPNELSTIPQSTATAESEWKFRPNST